MEKKMVVKEEEHKKKKDDLYSRMRKIRLSEAKTFGDQLKYIRGTGLVRR